MRQICDASQIDSQLFFSQHVDEPKLSGVERTPLRGESFEVTSLGEARWLTVVVARDEQSSFLEELSKRRHVVREAAFCDAESRRSNPIIQSVCQVVVTVLFVDGTTGIDVRTAHEITQHVATKHKNFITIGTVAQREHRCRRAWNNGIGHSRQLIDPTCAVVRCPHVH